MKRDHRPRIVAERIRVPDLDSRPSGAVAVNEIETSREWRSRLGEDRPVYDCPNCNQPALQFFAAHADYPERTEFFHCCACGTCWEI
jgi:DNA-directed RNA polymerase subunit M/transcription elongation factor TFIIS